MEASSSLALINDVKDALLERLNFVDVLPVIYGKNIWSINDNGYLRVYIQRRVKNCYNLPIYGTDLNAESIIQASDLEHLAKTIISEYIKNCWESLPSTGKNSLNNNAIEKIKNCSEHLEFNGLF
jgi:hypothetical protein